jgi:hypothetical protein
MMKGPVDDAGLGYIICRIAPIEVGAQKAVCCQGGPAGEGRARLHDLWERTNRSRCTP